MFFGSRHHVHADLRLRWRLPALRLRKIRTEFSVLSTVSSKHSTHEAALPTLSSDVLPSESMLTSIGLKTGYPADSSVDACLTTENTTFPRRCAISPLQLTVVHVITSCVL
uniref:Uncharacterized protein n=1 Tax=Steinernema glaseri TaxID=37863 RepID=A0A1I7Y619_9BILA